MKGTIEFGKITTIYLTGEFSRCFREIEWACIWLQSIGLKIGDHITPTEAEITTI